MPTLHDFTLGSAAGPVPLGDFHGSVVLVVATGRESGPTPQLGGLQRLSETFAAQGLVVLAVPEPPVPGGAAPSGAGLGVTFPVLGPTDDPGAAALLQWLSQQAPGAFGTTAVPGYTKFLVGRDGSAVTRFAATDDPAALVAAIQQALAQPAPPPIAEPPLAPAEGPTPTPAAGVDELDQRGEGSAPATSVDELDQRGEDSLADIAQDIYEVESEVRMVEELGREQRQAAIEAELAAALGEQQAVSQSDQPGEHVTSDPSIPDGESTPIAPDERPAPRDRST